MEIKCVNLDTVLILFLSDFFRGCFPHLQQFFVFFLLLRSVKSHFRLIFLCFSTNYFPIGVFPGVLAIVNVLQLSILISFLSDFSCSLNLLCHKDSLYTPHPQPCYKDSLHTPPPQHFIFYITFTRVRLWYQ